MHKDEQSLYRYINETGNSKNIKPGYTLPYCPPEQVEGAAARQWMDVYAWALTLYT